MEGNGSGAEGPREQCGGGRQQRSRRGFPMEHKHILGSLQGIFSLSSVQGPRRNYGDKFVIV